MAAIPDAEENESSGKPKGFRKRWLQRAAECFAVTNEPGSTSDVRDNFFPVDISDFGGNCSGNVHDPVDGPQPHFLPGPKKHSCPSSTVDSQWKTAAVIANAKLARFELPRMPWDQQPFNGIFGTLGNRVDDFLGSDAKRFMPTSIGLDESLEGYVGHGESQEVLPIASRVAARPLILRTLGVWPFRDFKICCWVIPKQQFLGRALQT